MRTHLHDILRDAARQFPASPALSAKDTTVSYPELWTLVEACGTGFTRSGIARGDRIAVFLDKRIETVVSIFGSSFAGGIVVPVNPQLRARQVGHILDDCGVRMLVTTADRWAMLSSELATCKTLDFLVLVDSADIPAEIDADIRSWQDVQSHQPGEPNGTIDSDVAAILYTSGSTGRPKGVVLSHRNMVVGAESVSEYLEKQNDRILAALPLSFDAGFSQLTTALARRRQAS